MSSLTLPNLALHVSLTHQQLSVLSLPEKKLINTYSVSTAKSGQGQLEGSGCTPLGEHYIRARIGADLPEGAVLVGRRWTGEVYSAALAAQYPDRDWILSRILWLCGCEPGYNRGGHVDSMRRYIYIHGTPDTEPMGVPGSAGCIRMRNKDIINLFEQVPVGTPLSIESQRLLLTDA